MLCYMAKPNFPEKQTTWGTWEELLLACAVHRYGADSWDSIASELRKRTSTLHFLTPLSCKQKYLDLKRRFSQNAVVLSVAAAAADGGAAGVASIPFLDELRRLRVAELRREVERYDLSIVTLESKVEKLKEERAQSLKEREEKADLEKKESKDGETKPENASPENSAEKAASGEGSVLDDRSVDESNSTNLKDNDEETGGAETGNEPEPPGPAGGEPDRATECGKPAVEDSYDGSSETIAKGSAAVSPVRVSEKVNSEKDGGGDSAESKGGEEGTKEAYSSEMQSWTSLSRKKVEEPDEPDVEDQSVATKRAHHVESKTLVDFLEILRSHKSGSFFERRLDVQETPNYINMIRQHIDFEMVRIRLEEGWYSGCKSKFFRDVLLILNNAIVFFSQKSPESMAAIELRLLVLKEMAQKTATKENSSPKEEAQALKQEPEGAEQPSDMLLKKPKLSVPMNACRKRSSITARAGSTSSSGPERKKEQASALLDVKPAMSWKQSDKSSDKAEELPSTKKKRKERFRAGTKNNSNKTSASRSDAENNKNSGADSNTGPSTRGGTSNENSASKSDKKNNGSNASGKKQSVANFLNRMKRSSSSNNGSLLETLKETENSRGMDQKKNGGNKGKNKQKEQTSLRRSSGGKQAKEQESPTKRSVGRPSKRPATAPPASVPAKRIRQSVEKEVTPRNAKKRSRR